MLDDLFSVQDRVVIVTGGLGQLGRQFSLALADRGAKVAIFDVQVDEERIADRFGERRNDKQLMFVPVDTVRSESIEAALRRVNEKWGIPHALINNAALDSPPNAPLEENGPFETYPESSWDKVMAVNTKGVLLCCQVIGGQMATAGRGPIINISSIFGLVSLNMTRYLATYWAEQHVRVNTLTFGGVFNAQDAQFLEGYCARVPLGRMAREDEYNGAIVFLVSEASSYMTGANLVIDGGWTAW